MSKNFFGTKNEQEEEASRQRYLQYLRVAQGNSAKKESAEFEMPIEPEQLDKRPLSELLADQAEVDRIVQQNLSKLLQSPSGKPRNINETDDEYLSRSNPIQFVMNRITPSQKKLLITNVGQILADVKDVKMLPQALLTYLDTYERLQAETGGVRGFANQNRVIAEIQALRNTLPNTTQIQQTLNNIRGLQAVMRQEVTTQGQVSQAEAQRVNALLSSVLGSLNAIGNVIEQVDYNRIADLINQGAEDISRDNVIISDDLFGRLVDELTKLSRLNMEGIQTAVEIGLDDLREALDVDDAKERSRETMSAVQQIAIKFRQIENKLNNIATENDINDIKQVLAEIRQLSRDRRRLVPTTPTTPLPMEAPSSTPKKRRQTQSPIGSPASTPIGTPRQSPMTIPDIVSGVGVKGTFAKKRQHPIMSVVKGRGIHLEEEPKFVEFGKYALSLPKLQSKQLTAKYLKSGSPVSSLTNIEISDDLQDILTSFIDTQKLNEKHLQKLNPNEKRVFTKLINGSGLYGKYKVKLESGEQEKKENERFELLKGIITAGNDSAELLKEFKQLLIKFINDGRIQKRQGLDLLYEINIYSGGV